VSHEQREDGEGDDDGVGGAERDVDDDEEQSL